MSERVKLKDAAKLLRMNHKTVETGLKQGVFPWVMQSRHLIISTDTLSMQGGLQKLKVSKYRQKGWCRYE